MSWSAPANKRRPSPTGRPPNYAETPLASLCAGLRTTHMQRTLPCATCPRQSSVRFTAQLPPIALTCNEISPSPALFRWRCRSRLRRGRRLWSRCRNWDRRCLFRTSTILLGWFLSHASCYTEFMPSDKNLDSLLQLDDEVLKEVIREGELRLGAQFAAATASDQRAMAWIGFLITIASATIAASASLAITGKHLPLAVISGLLSGLLCISAYTAIHCVRPRKFALPGNLPENWLPREWEAGKERSMKQARIEQARCLNSQIEENADWAKITAVGLHRSMDLACLAILLAAVYTGGFVLFQLMAANS